MPARYFDRTGKEITREQWEPLFRDPNYFVVKHLYRRGDWTEIEASWLGLWVECEPRPLMYYIHHFRWLKLDNGQERRETIKDGWCTTERDAVETAIRWSKAR